MQKSFDLIFILILSAESATCLWRLIFLFPRLESFAPPRPLSEQREHPRALIARKMYGLF
jgi:hypothetical protein